MPAGTVEPIPWPRPSRRIASDELKEAHLPPPESQAQLILAFANSFDGFEYIAAQPMPHGLDHGNPVFRLSRYARAVFRDYKETEALPGCLDDLRSCLWWEWRRWRWGPPQESVEWVDYLHALLEAVRTEVRKLRGEPRSDAAFYEAADVKPLG